MAKATLKIYICELMRSTSVTESCGHAIKKIRRVGTYLIAAENSVLAAEYAVKRFVESGTISEAKDHESLRLMICEYDVPRGPGFLFPTDSNGDRRYDVRRTKKDGATKYWPVYSEKSYA